MTNVPTSLNKCLKMLSKIKSETEEEKRRIDALVLKARRKTEFFWRMRCMNEKLEDKQKKYDVSRIISVGDVQPAQGSAAFTVRGQVISRPVFFSEANKISKSVQDASSANLILPPSEENDNNDSRWQQSHSLLYFFPSATGPP